MQSGRNEISVFSDIQRAKEIITTAFINLMNKKAFSVVIPTVAQILRSEPAFKTLLKKIDGNPKFDITFKECESQLTGLTNYIARSSAEKHHIIQAISKEIFSFIESNSKEEIINHYYHTKEKLIFDYKNWDYKNWIQASVTGISASTWLASINYLGIISTAGLFYFVSIPILAISFNVAMNLATCSSLPSSGNKKIDLANKIMRFMYPAITAQNQIDFFIHKITPERRKQWPYITYVLNEVGTQLQHLEAPLPSSSEVKNPTSPKNKVKTKGETIKTPEETAKQTEMKQENSGVFKNHETNTTYIQVSHTLFFKHDPKAVTSLLNDEKIAERILSTVEQKPKIHSPTYKKSGLKWIGEKKHGWDVKIKLNGGGTMGGGLRIGYGRRPATKEEEKVISVADKQNVEILSPRIIRRK